MVRREAFVEAGERLIQARTYERTSIQDILDDLGASRGAFYHYFDSKQALLEAVIHRMGGAGLAPIEAILREPRLPPADKLGRQFRGIARGETDAEEHRRGVVDR